MASCRSACGQLLHDTFCAKVSILHQHLKLLDTGASDICLSIHTLFQEIKRLHRDRQKTFDGKKISFSLTTNGTLITDEMINFLSEENIHLVVSLDGPKEIHDKSRVFADGRGIHILSHNRNFIDAIIVIQRIHNHTKSNPLCILRDTIPEFFNIAYNSIKTTACNLRCKYCIYSDDVNPHQRSHSSRRMTWATAKKGIDFLWEHSVDSPEVNVGFYGERLHRDRQNLILIDIKDVLATRCFEQLDKRFCQIDHPFSLSIFT